MAAQNDKNMIQFKMLSIHIHATKMTIRMAQTENHNEKKYLNNLKRNPLIAFTVRL